MEHKKIKITKFDMVLLLILILIIMLLLIIIFSTSKSKIEQYCVDGNYKIGDGIINNFDEYQRYSDVVKSLLNINESFFRDNSLIIITDIGLTGTVRKVQINNNIATVVIRKYKGYGSVAPSEVTYFIPVSNKNIEKVVGIHEYTNNIDDIIPIILILSSILSLLIGIRNYKVTKKKMKTKILDDKQMSKEKEKAIAKLVGWIFTSIFLIYILFLWFHFTI